MLHSNRSKLKMANRKAQSMPLNVIIIAALAIIILIVMIVIFGTRMQLFGKGVSTCEGSCSATKAGCGDRAAIPIKNCDDKGTGEPTVKGEGFCCMVAG